MTIEERANELYCDADGYVKDSSNDYMRIGYIKGAEEMLDKACDAFCKALCGKVTNACHECYRYRVLRKSLEK